MRPARARVSGVVFLVVIALGPLGYWLLPPGPLPVGAEWPVFGAESVRRGAWAGAVGDQLRLRWPLTRYFRGAHNELRARLGVFDAANVVEGRGGWCFARETVDDRVAAWRRCLPELRRWLATVRARSAAAGVRVAAAPAPNKVCVYGDRLPGGAPAWPRRQYADLLDELRAAGLEVVDLLACLDQRRAERPDLALFAVADTHWSGAALLAVSAALRNAVGGPMARDAAQPLVALPTVREVREGDLARLLGLWPGTPAARTRLDEDYVLAVGRRSDAGAIALPPAQPSARVAVVGDSFAARLPAVLSGCLGSAVDGSAAVAASGPRAGLDATLARAENGGAVRVIIWVCTQRATWDQRFW